MINQRTKSKIYQAKFPEPEYGSQQYFLKGIQIDLHGQQLNQLLVSDYKPAQLSMLQQDPTLSIISPVDEAPEQDYAQINSNASEPEYSQSSKQNLGKTVQFADGVKLTDSEQRFVQTNSVFYS